MWNTIKQKLGHILSVLAILLAGGNVAHQMYGASSPTFEGDTLTYNGTIGRHERVRPYGLVEAGACVTVDTTPVPLGDSGTATYWGAAEFNCKLPANPCEAGVCTAWQESKVPLDFLGTQCCVQGGSLCSSDGGGLSSYNLNDSPTASGAPAYGVSSQIACNFAAGTASLVACAGTNSACYVGGTVSEVQRTTPVASSSSGGSSGGSSSGGSSSGGSSSGGSSSGGSSSGGSSSGGSGSGGSSGCGSPPTITAQNTDVIPANGSVASNLTIVGTGLGTGSATISGTIAAPTIVSQSATSVTFSTAASSVSTTDGNGSASTLTFTASPGCTATTSVWVWPSWYTSAVSGLSGGLWTLQSATTSAGHVATVPDLSGNTGSALTPTSGAPAYTAAGSLSYATFTNFSTLDEINYSGFPTQDAGAAGDWIWAGQTSTTAANGIALMVGTGPGAECYVIQNGSMVLNQYCGSIGNAVTIPAINTNFWVEENFQGSSSFAAINGGSQVTGTSPGSQATGNGATMGGYPPGPGDNWEGIIYMMATGVNGALTSTGRANLAAYFTAKGI